MDKSVTICIDESYEKAINEIAKVWGDVTTKSDIIKYCIYYTWKHAVKNQQKNSSSIQLSEN